MPFIVETPQTHPGIKLYVNEVPGTGRRQAFALKGGKDGAHRFSTFADAMNSRMHFSSNYGLIISEVKK